MLNLCKKTFFEILKLFSYNFNSKHFIFDRFCGENHKNIDSKLTFTISNFFMRNIKDYNIHRVVNYFEFENDKTIQDESSI